MNRKMTFILNGILVIVSVLSFMTYNFIAVRQSAVFPGLAVSDTDIAIVADAQVPLGDGLQTTDGGAGEVNVTAISMMEDKDYAGILYFPALKLELPVCDDDTPENLKESPCRYQGSCTEDDLVICGHADNANFGRISQLHLYDPVTFMDTEGSIYVYQIVRIDVIEPYQISDQLHETMDLTLFTCTSDGKDSVMLRCRRIRL